jgi:hypothetical protein
MIRPYKIVIIGVIVSLSSLSVTWGTSNPNTELTDCFEVSLEKAAYRFSASVSNSSDDQRKQATEQLELYCKVKVLNPNLVTLGISSRGIITQFENEKGENVDVVYQIELTNRLNRYNAPRYRSGPVVPSKPVRPAILKRQQTNGSEPQWTDFLEPVLMRLELDPRLPGRESKKINHIKGYFYVLMADSIEYIEVPFEPNETWVRLTPDVEIQVLEAESTESDYRYRVETRRDEKAFEGSSLYPGYDLPKQLPLKQEFLNKQGKSIRNGHSMSTDLYASVGEEGGGAGSNIGSIETIRFAIAVNPSHHKIPFELDNILLPEAPVNTMILKPNLPVIKMGKKAHTPQYSPKLSNGNMLEQNSAQLLWKPGSNAVSHNVYLGDNFNDVNSSNGPFRGNQTSTNYAVGIPGHAYPDGLVPGTTYYWRIDEVNETDSDSPWKGEVWSFSVALSTAHNPNPPDGSKFVDPNVHLSWTEGFGANLHIVYFGNNFEDVNNAKSFFDTTFQKSENVKITIRGRPRQTSTYDPGLLEPNKTYYWRVDEMAGRTTHKGDVWSFTVNNGTVSEPVSEVKK